MLEHLPDASFIKKIPGRFPEETSAMLRPYWGKADVVIAYSVLHHIRPASHISVFLNRAMALLARGGTLLIGDIPNRSKRRRFAATPRGRRLPPALKNRRDPFDDAALLGFVAWARRKGYEAFLLPQGQALPMANRREDLLIYKP